MINDGLHCQHTWGAGCWKGTFEWAFSKFSKEKKMITSPSHRDMLNTILFQICDCSRPEF